MFKKTSVSSVKENLIDLIKNEWMLISAGDQKAHNMMTASWGFMGEMWGEDCVVIAVRPQRYTLEFLNKFENFSLSFYGDNKKIHKVCGSMSGRDVNKTELSGLTPVFADGTVYFEEARLVAVCKKLYVGKLEKEKFFDKEIAKKWYPDDDFHYMIVAKIEKVLEK